MTIDEFKGAASPKGFPVELEALWYDGKGDWNKSHDTIQDVYSKNAAWIHAYLHRKEGDLGNAQYWYSKAGKAMPNTSLDDEWTALVEHFLKS
jgi:hypothetical protein